jgi:hypothetical protein
MQNSYDYLSMTHYYSIYPYPSDYLVELMEPHRNVEKIELMKEKTSKIQQIQSETDKKIQQNKEK